MPRPGEIEAAAQAFRDKHWPNGGIPVDIELMLERLGIDIVPIANLRRGACVDACISADLTQIYIDLEYYQKDHMWNRVRFSEAHELGHIVLHAHLFTQFRESSPLDVQAWARSIRERLDTLILEREADEFASCLLVPREELQVHYDDAMSTAREQFREKGLDIDEYDPDSLRAHLANPIHRHFEVSPQTIEVRLRKYGICPNG